MTKKIRLNKFFSEAGICSRRSADEHISNGEVTINGAKASVGALVDPITDTILYKGKEVKRPEEKIYLALYKPVGYVSTTKSQNNEKNILSLIKSKERVYPIGRLDKDSEGLIILTNDGELTKKLTHPSFQHQKEYLVYGEDETDSLTVDKLKNKFERGMKIDGKIMKADRVFNIDISGRRIRFKIILHTGLKRQIRRMSAIIRVRITRIIRIRLANLTLDALGLKPGESKEILKTDIL